MNAAIPGRIQCGNRKPRSLAFSDYFRRQAARQFSSVMSFGEPNKVESNLGLASLKTKIGKKGRYGDFGLEICRLPHVDALVGRVSRRLMIERRPAEVLFQKSWNRRIGFREADLCNVVSRSVLVVRALCSARSLDGDKAIRVNGPRQIGINHFRHTRHCSYGANKGKKAAGCLLDGIEHNGFPEARA